MSDETKTVGDLRGAPYNPRTISDPKLAALDKAMQKFGDLSGIVFNRTTGQLVGGHQRVKNLPPDAPITLTMGLGTPNAQGTIAIGYVEVNGERWLYREVIWDETTERAANVAANQHGGTWDETLLADLLTDLQAGGYDMPLTGFEGEDLAAVLNQMPTEGDWASALEERSGDTSNDDAAQITFVLDKASMARLSAHLRTIDTDKNLALVKWLDTSL